MEVKPAEMQTVSEFYEKDHDRLDDLFKNFQQWKNKDYFRAKEYFVAFKFGLQRHIVWEEEILFPFFEKHSGMVESGPTAVMRQEHRLIGEALEAIHKKVQLMDPNSDPQEKKLLYLLGQHNQKEENILYPAIDNYVSDPVELEEIYDEMKKIPDERYKTCCDHG